MTKVSVKGRGKISIKLKDTSQNFISNVLYIPSVHQDLFKYEAEFRKKGMICEFIRTSIASITNNYKRLITKVKMT